MSLSLKRFVRKASSQRRMLPNFLVIGAMRAGSTTLFDMLCRHPQMQAPITKEIHYFDSNLEKGIEWYKANFPLKRTGSDCVTGEATPSYLFLPHVPSLVASMLPSVKLLVILRNPISRALSHYNHELLAGRERRLLEEALMDDMLRPDTSSLRNHMRKSYVRRGLYGEQLERWAEYFDRNCIKVLTLSQFVADPNRVLNTVFEHIGISANLRIADMPRRNAQDYEDHVPQPLEDALRDFLGRDLEILEKWVHPKPNWFGSTVGREDDL